VTSALSPFIGPRILPTLKMSFEPRDYVRHILIEADYLIAAAPASRSTRLRRRTPPPLSCGALRSSAKPQRRSPKISAAHPAVSGVRWRMRDRLIHDYFGIDLELVWTWFRTDSGIAIPSAGHTRGLTRWSRRGTTDRITPFRDARRSFRRSRRTPWVSETNSPDHCRDVTIVETIVETIVRDHVGHCRDDGAHSLSATIPRLPCGPIVRHPPRPV